MTLSAAEAKVSLSREYAPWWPGPLVLVGPGPTGVPWVLTTGFHTAPVEEVIR